FAEPRLPTRCARRPPRRCRRWRLRSLIHSLRRPEPLALPPARQPHVSLPLRPSRLRRRFLRFLLSSLFSALATSSHALRRSTRWIGFSEDVDQRIAEGANIRRQSRITCQRVADDAFHLTRESGGGRSRRRGTSIARLVVSVRFCRWYAGLF